MQKLRRKSNVLFHHLTRPRELCFTFIQPIFGKVMKTELAFFWHKCQRSLWALRTVFGSLLGFPKHHSSCTKWFVSSMFLHWLPSFQLHSPLVQILGSALRSRYSSHNSSLVCNGVFSLCKLVLHPHLLSLNFSPTHPVTSQSQQDLELFPIPNTN